MNREEFSFFVRHQTEEARISLVMQCINRFLEAATLVRLEGKIVDGIRNKVRTGCVSIEPLAPLWDYICEYFTENLYDSQMDLFENHTELVLERWNSFCYEQLFAACVRNDDFVRNLLRALELLPSKRSPKRSLNALMHFIAESDMSYGYVRYIPKSEELI